MCVGGEYGDPHIRDTGAHISGNMGTLGPYINNECGDPLVKI